MPEQPIDPMDLPGDTYLVTPEMWEAIDPGSHPELVARVMREVKPIIAELAAKMADIFGLEPWQVGVATLVQVHGQPWSVLTNLDRQHTHEIIRNAFLQMAVLRLAEPSEGAIDRLMRALNEIPDDPTTENEENT